MVYVSVTGTYWVSAGGQLQSFHVVAVPGIAVEYVPVTNIETRLKAERGLGASILILCLEQVAHNLHQQHTKRATRNERLGEKASADSPRHQKVQKVSGEEMKRMRYQRGNDILLGCPTGRRGLLCCTCLARSEIWFLHNVGSKLPAHPFPFVIWK